MVNNEGEMTGYDLYREKQDAVYEHCNQLAKEGKFEEVLSYGAENMKYVEPLWTGLGRHSHCVSAFNTAVKLSLPDGENMSRDEFYAACKQFEEKLVPNKDTYKYLDGAAQLLVKNDISLDTYKDAFLYDMMRKDYVDMPQLMYEYVLFNDISRKVNALQGTKAVSVENNWTIQNSKKGEPYVNAQMEIDGEMKNVHFKRTYGVHEFSDEEIGKLIAGDTISIKSRSGQPLDVKLGSTKYMGKEGFGVVLDNSSKQASREGLPDIGNKDDAAEKDVNEYKG